MLQGAPSFLSITQTYFEQFRLNALGFEQLHMSWLGTDRMHTAEIPQDVKNSCLVPFRLARPLKVPGYEK